ncbi:MAG: hypothetical protein EOO39_46360 [Cytophagaceae bacterium]|nr:MAG: hypothetical protein EOO39_46360 [Cytophagaceae bacterium]
MNTLRILVLTSVLFGSLLSCKKDDGNDPNPTVTSQTELLVANNWQVTSITTPDGQLINYSRLNLVSQVLPQLKFQFRADNSVRAFDPKQSNSTVNAGSWYLATDNKSMDVDVTGFKGNFPIIQLSRNKLILRQIAPVDGKNADINLVFDPAL